MRIKKLALCILGLSALAASVTNTQAQSMQEDIRAQWATYIVVSSSVPRDQLVSLAHDAGLAGAIIVLNGFPNKIISIHDVQIMISEINAACCDRANQSRWVIDPKIAERYHVSAVPSFVIARGESARDGDFSVITGDMDLANALKSFAQRSGIYAIRQRAMAVYQHAFVTP